MNHKEFVASFLYWVDFIKWLNIPNIKILYLIRCCVGKTKFNTNLTVQLVHLYILHYISWDKHCHVAFPGQCWQVVDIVDSFIGDVITIICLLQLPNGPDSFFIMGQRMHVGSTSKFEFFMSLKVTSGLMLWFLISI